MDVAHELLLRDAPRSADRPEVSPAVIGGEARRTVGTPAAVDVVLVVETVVQTGEVGFDGVAVGLRTGVVDRGADNFVDAAHQTRTRTGQVVLLVIVVLVAEQGADLVLLVERPVVGNQLVERVGHVAVVVLLDQTAVRCLVAEVRIVIRHVVRRAVIDTEVERGLEALEPAGLVVVAAEGEIGAGREALGGVRRRVVVEAGDAVCVGVLRTGRTVVELLLAVFVEQQGARLGITHVDRVDRGHQLGRVEDVRVGRSGVAVRVALRVREVGVHAAGEPVAGRRVVADAAGVALEVGGLQHTVLVEVAQRHASAVDVVTA